MLINLVFKILIGFVASNNKVSYRYPSYNPSFVFGVTINCPCFVFNFLNIWIAPYVSAKVRLLSAISAIFVFLLMMPIIAESFSEHTGWIVILANIGKDHLLPFIIYLKAFLTF